METVQELRSFRETGSVLFIAAHPDDENNRLIAYLSRGRALRTGYLSLTRGDGGQNLAGPELREELGVIRTQELLAGRREDGAQQFFSRANDFGFSKSYEETLAVWNRQEVLADVVRVIRKFRPDVIITRFSTEPGGTHGHHTSSAILALEAFKIAGDPNKFPEQLGELAPWQAKRIFWNNGFGRGSAATDTQTNSIRLDVGGFEPLSGKSFGEIAASVRSMHKTQGQGGIGSRGASLESFTLLSGEPAAKDLLDGIDTTWARITGGSEITHLTDDIISQFKPLDPSASVPALLVIHAKLAALPRDPTIAEKLRQLDRIIQSCAGLYVETTIPQADVVPGESLKMRHTAIVRSQVSVKWLGETFPGAPTLVAQPILLSYNRAEVRETIGELPAETELTHPYWLRQEGSVGMYRVDNAELIGNPENLPPCPIEHVFEMGGQTVVISDSPVHVFADPIKGEIRQALAVIPPLYLSLPETLELLAPGMAKKIVVAIHATRPNLSGSINLPAPPGWNISPDVQPFKIAVAGETASVEFTITAPARPATAKILVNARIDGKEYHQSRDEIIYDHIPPQLLQPTVFLKTVSLDLSIGGKRIGYIPGAGDLIAESLRRMGYSVSILSSADINPDRLKAFDAVVVGIRAFNARNDIPAHMKELFAFVEGGGNVIMQYNRVNDLQTTMLAPYSLQLSNDRVTDENAPITFLEPMHPALTTPNRITSADFEGWVQERGLNFPNQWDSHFVPLLSCADPGEAQNKGSLLVASYGRGYFVYTGLSFFRQLPEGVPGAYRLFANLVSLGKK